MGLRRRFRKWWLYAAFCPVTNGTSAMYVGITADVTAALARLEAIDGRKYQKVVAVSIGTERAAYHCKEAFLQLYRDHPRLNRRILVNTGLPVEKELIKRAMQVPTVLMGRECALAWRHWENRDAASPRINKSVDK